MGAAAPIEHTRIAGSLSHTVRSRLRDPVHFVAVLEHAVGRLQLLAAHGADARARFAGDVHVAELVVPGSLAGEAADHGVELY